MLQLEIINGNLEICKIKEEIIALGQQLGDSREFSERFIKISDILAAAKENDKLIGFSIAINSISHGLKGVMFFATRVLPEYQNKKIGNILVESLLKKCIKSQGLNLFRPFYFVTGTAHPIVYSVFCKKSKVIPSIKDDRITALYKKIVKDFAATFFPELSLDTDNFVLKGAFSNSAESFNPEKIPWSNDNEVNQFLESRLNLTKQLGNMLIIVAKVPKLWEIKEYLFG